MFMLGEKDNRTKKGRTTFYGQRKSLPAYVRAYVRSYMRACVRACLRACVRVGVRACGRACVCACVRVCVRACVRGQPENHDVAWAGSSSLRCSRRAPCNYENCLCCLPFQNHLSRQTKLIELRG